MKIEHVEINWTEPAKRLHEIPDNECAKRGVEVALSGSHDVIFLSTVFSPASDLFKAAARIAKENDIPFKGKLIPVCNCGCYGTAKHECTCSNAELKKYANKVVPIIKSASMLIEVIEPCYNSSKRNDFELEKSIVSRILQSRRKNAIPSKEISSDVESFLKLAVTELHVDRERLISLAMTIARMDSSFVIELHHMAEAIQYNSYRPFNSFNSFK